MAVETDVKISSKNRATKISSNKAKLAPRSNRPDVKFVPPRQYPDTIPNVFDESEVTSRYVSINLRPRSIDIGIFRKDIMNKKQFDMVEVSADIERLEKLYEDEIDANDNERLQYQIVKSMIKSVTKFREQHLAVDEDGDELDIDDARYPITDMTEVEQITMIYPSHYSEEECRKLYRLATAFDLNIGPCIPRVVACALGYTYQAPRPDAKVILFNVEDERMDVIVFEIVDGKPNIFARGSCLYVSTELLTEVIEMQFIEQIESKYSGWEVPGNVHGLDPDEVKQNIKELVQEGVENAYTEDNIITKYFGDPDDPDTISAFFDCERKVVNSLAYPVLSRCHWTIEKVLGQVPSQCTLGLDTFVFTGSDTAFIPFIKECLDSATICKVKCIENAEILDDFEIIPDLALIGATTNNHRLLAHYNCEIQRKESRPLTLDSFSGHGRNYISDMSIDIRTNFVNINGFYQDQPPSFFNLKKKSKSKSSAAESKAEGVAMVKKTKKVVE
ncbi:hypothetical protein H4219_004415 [Mycoemilia scoparia]|uniref:Uncharacterized protein n=1 Tax=Mycoemilia scoparia TaxID=417184 RepID=A0A9W8DMW2_9FUNG|nr:hypothetical protein H4219_004415 [Mycoemilia scoparia]